MEAMNKALRFLADLTSAATGKGTDSNHPANSNLLTYFFSFFLQKLQLCKVNVNNNVFMAVRDQDRDLKDLLITYFNKKSRIQRSRIFDLCGGSPGVETLLIQIKDFLIKCGFVAQV